VDRVEVNGLAAEVRALREEIGPLRASILRLDRSVKLRTRWLIAAVACTAAVLIAVAAAAVFADLEIRRQIAAANRKLCPMIALLLPDPSAPPTTPRAVELAHQAEILYTVYDCRKDTS